MVKLRSEDICPVSKFVTVVHLKLKQNQSSKLIFIPKFALLLSLNFFFFFKVDIVFFLILGTVIELFKVNACVSHSVISDSVTPWIVSCQAPLSMELSMQEYWSV